MKNIRHCIKIKQNIHYRLHASASGEPVHMYNCVCKMFVCKDGIINLHLHPKQRVNSSLLHSRQKITALISVKLACFAHYLSRFNSTVDSQHQ